MNKLAHSLKEAIIDSGLRDGMTISFHHHLRNGDFVLNMVMDEIASLGLKHLTVKPCLSPVELVHSGLRY